MDKEIDPNKSNKLFTLLRHPLTVGIVTTLVAGGLLHCIQRQIQDKKFLKEKIDLISEDIIRYGNRGMIVLRNIEANQKRRPFLSESEKTIQDREVQKLSDEHLEFGAGIEIKIPLLFLDKKEKANRALKEFDVLKKYFLAAQSESLVALKKNEDVAPIAKGYAKDITLKMINVINALQEKD